MKRFSKRLALVLLVCALCCGGSYGVVAYRYWNNLPQITRNYAEELNAPVRAVPDAERAWPVYREVMTKLHQRAPDAYLRIDDCWGDPFGAADRPLHSKFLRAQREFLSAARTASKRRSLGHLLSTGESKEDFAFRARRSVAFQFPGPAAPVSDRPGDDNPSMLAVQLTPAVELYELVGVLQADAVIAARDGDPRRMVDDLGAILRLAQQLREIPLSTNDYYAARYYGMGLQTWAHLMRVAPERFDEAALKELEELTRAFAGGDLRVRLEGDRATFADLVQRCYADDGDGDGYLFVTAPDVGFMYEYSTYGWDRKLLAPLSTDDFLKRNQFTQAFEGVLRQAEADLARPYWQCIDWPYLRILDGFRQDRRYRPIDISIRKLARYGNAAEQAVQQRDAALTVSALMRFRGERGDWPRQLADLVPKYLAAPPVDRFTGLPLHYVTTDGEPILYSSGADGVDDGGRPAWLAPGGNQEGYLGHLPERAWHWWSVEVPPMTQNVPAQLSGGDFILWPAVAPEQLEYGLSLKERLRPEDEAEIP